MKIFFVIIAFIGNIDLAKSQIFNDLNWLLGSWKMKQEGVEFSEIWTKNDSTSFSGKGIGITGNDTIFYEEIQLQFNQGEICYNVKSIEQNDNETVSFKLVNHGINTFVFENINHDFPSLIVYKRKDESHMEAWIEGRQNGVIKSESFEFLRMK
jgi:uncharacterized protein YfaT (DUF1175 family)